MFEGIFMSIALSLVPQSLADEPVKLPSVGEMRCQYGNLVEKANTQQLVDRNTQVRVNHMITSVEQHGMELGPKKNRDTLVQMELSLGKIFSSGKFNELIRSSLSQFHTIPPQTVVKILSDLAFDKRSDEQQIRTATRFNKKIRKWLGANPKSLSAYAKAKELGYDAHTFGEYLEALRHLENFDITKYLQLVAKDAGIDEVSDLNRIMGIAGIASNDPLFEQLSTLWTNIEKSHHTWNAMSKEEREEMAFQKATDSADMASVYSNAFRKMGFMRPEDRVYFLKHPEAFPDEMVKDFMNYVRNHVGIGNEPVLNSGSGYLDFGPHERDAYRNFLEQLVEESFVSRLLQRLPQLSPDSLARAAGIEPQSKAWAVVSEKTAQMELTGNSYPMQVVLRSGLLQRALLSEMMQEGFKVKDLEEGLTVLKNFLPEEHGRIADNVVARVIGAVKGGKERVGDPRLTKEEKEAISKVWDEVSKDDFHDLRLLAHRMLMVESERLGSMIKEQGKPIAVRSMGITPAEEHANAMWEKLTQPATTRKYLDATTYTGVALAGLGGLGGAIYGMSQGEIPVVLTTLGGSTIGFFSSLIAFISGPLLYDEFVLRPLAVLQKGLRMKRPVLLTQEELSVIPEVSAFREHASRYPVLLSPDLVSPSSVEDRLLETARRLDEGHSLDQAPKERYAE